MDEFQRLFAEDKIQELVDRVYTEDCKFMPHGTPTVEGRKGVHAIFTDERKSLADNLVLKTKEIKSGEGFAYATGIYKFKKCSKLVDIGKYVVIWKKENGDYKIYIDIFNSDKSS